MRLKFIPLLAALLAAPILLTGCGSESRNVLAPETSQAPTSMKSSQPGGPDMAQGMRSGRDGWEGNRARTMFVHASPDAPAVDILVDSYKVARGLEYPSNTRYVAVRPGERRVRVNAAGTSTSVIDAKVTFASRRNYSVFAVNQLASVTGIEPLVLEDDLTRPAPGNAHVRFIHLSPDAPAVDIAVQGGPVVFANKSFKEYTPFTPLPAGTYDLEVRVAGTSTVALSLPGVRFKEGRIYTVFAKGLLGGTGEQALGAELIVNGGKNRSDRDDEDDDRD